MKGIILLEGPDASGKSTLAKKIIEKYGGVYMHLTYRFANKMHLYQLAMLRKALKLSRKTLVIIDRMHISEKIYADVYRGGTKWPWLETSFNSFFKKMKFPIVLCVPETLEQGLNWFEKAKNERPEMYSDVTEVIKRYIDYAKNNKNIIVYNRDLNDQYSFYLDYTLAEIEHYLVSGEI